MDTSPDFAQEQALFTRCLDHPETEWDALLREHCGDPSLRSRVRRLLERHRDVPVAESAFLRLDGSDPERIGPYRVMQRLGKGGMGVVYAAEQRDPVRRRVAIKVLRDGFASREVLARFDVERQALALMNHPNIARILDAGTTPDHRPFIAMEFVPGEAITAFCERQMLPLEQRLQLFCEVCDAIQHAHQKGVIHRDIKPSNILVTEEHGRPTPKVIDFGIAKAIAQRLTDHTLETKIGSLLGTPDYMSPEQIDLSPLDVDTRADVYALGAVLYELLCGVPPFSLKNAGHGFAELQRIVREIEPPPPSARANGAAAKTLRGELDWVVQRALQKERSRRYGSAAELRDDIQRYLAREPTRAGPPSKLRHVKKFVRRHQFSTLLAATAAFVVVGLAVGMTLQARWLSAERDRADRAAEIAETVSAFMVDAFRGADPVAQGGHEWSAREVLDRGARQVETRFSAPSATRAALYSAIGSAYLNLGKLQEAERYTRQALADALAIHGASHIETLEYESAIGRLLISQGRFTEALEHSRRHVAHAESVLGPDHELTLRGRRSMSTALEQIGRPEEALVILEDLLPRLRATFGAEAPETVYALANLASALDTAGRFDEALPIQRAAVAALEKLHGSDHPYTLGVRFNLADTLTDLQQLEQSETLHRDVLARRERVLGAAHSHTIASLRALATVVEARGRLADALGLMRDARRRSGDSANVSGFIRLETDIGYARLLRLAGDAGEAEALLRAAIDELQTLVGIQHWLLGRAWREIALIAFARGDVDAARQTATQALRAGLEPEHLRETELAALPDFDKIVAAARDPDDNADR